MNSEQNFRAAQSTYNGFVGLVKWGTIAAVIVTALVVLLIAR
ncbi:MAG: aa3-type cytochrome c oxidase subunit IV [Sphingobium sp.]